MSLSALALCCALLPACSLLGHEDEPSPPFQPGEYGGEPLPGTEELYNVQPSPDGRQVALVRKRTPGVPTDPRGQLWITEPDGSDPRLIAVNVGGVDWSPDGTHLAVTVIVGIDAYVYTIDLATLEAMQWSGREDQFFSKPTVSNPKWFDDGRRLLVSVMAKAYQQPFERGFYVIDTETGQIDGPIVEVMQAAWLGNHDAYVIGRKYTYEENPLSGNFARYDFASGAWSWITDFPQDSLVFVDVPVPSPAGTHVVQSRQHQNAQQLFLMDHRGEDVRQITTLGGDNPSWAYDGSSFTFRRDIHRGEGARYIPFRYDLASGEAAPLWPSLPDSVPQFPPLATQALVR